MVFKAFSNKKNFGFILVFFRNKGDFLDNYLDFAVVN